MMHIFPTRTTYGYGMMYIRESGPWSDKFTEAVRRSRVSEAPIRVAQVMGIMNHGGVEAVVMNYYRGVARDRVQFDFFVDVTSSFPQREEIEKLGGRCYNVPPYSKPLRYISTLRRLFRKNGYSIVHSQINTMGVFPLFAAWLAGVPVRICHNHSTAHHGEGKKTILKYLLRPFARLFATDYFACGDTAARWMFGSRLVDRGSVTLLANAIDLSRYRFSADDRSTVRAEFDIGENALVVGHVGRFTYAKNHTFLLQIFQAVLQHHPEAVLLLVGEGELLASSKALAHELGITSYVRFLGARGDVCRLYSAMDVFCLPSYYEGLPVVMVEALANGLPCVVSSQVTQELNQFSVTQLRLNVKTEQWAETLTTAKRTGILSPTLTERYDIRQAAKRLTRFYLSKAADTPAINN